MSPREPAYELPKQLERWLAALTKIYIGRGSRQHAEILVNAQVRVHEGWTSDNWNGGTYGHALYLVLRENLYLAAVEQKERLAEQIKNDLNKLHNVQNEFVAEIFFEMEAAEDHDWRTESGLLVTSHPAVSVSALERIWGRGYRVFLSHKDEVKKEAASLKDRLRLFGISCFVAHEDIHPTTEWQDEIERALVSMDAFVALMTEKFHESLWTDQEVGFALGRGVPMIAVKLGKDPYGFLGKFQALSCDWNDAPFEIAQLLIRHPRMLDAYIVAVELCSSFDEGNTLSKLMPLIQHLTKAQVQRLMAAFNENGQVRDSWGFNGLRPSYCGYGLAHYLGLATGEKYELTESGKMRVVK